MGTVGPIFGPWDLRTTESLSLAYALGTVR